MLASELRDLFGRRLVAEYCNRGVARHEFNQNRDERDDRPHDEQEYEQASGDVEKLVLHQNSGAGIRIELREDDNTRRKDCGIRIAEFGLRIKRGLTFVSEPCTSRRRVRMNEETARLSSVI